jgi:hypothetical protein
MKDEGGRREEGGGREGGEENAVVRGRGRGGAVERLRGGESPLGNVWKGGDTWASWTFFWRRPRYHCQESGLLECWKSEILEV